MVSEPTLERVARVERGDRVPREYGYGVGKLYLHAHRTHVYYGRWRSAGWDMKRALVRAVARPKDGHAAHGTLDGDDDAGYVEVVEKVSVQLGILSVV